MPRSRQRRSCTASAGLPLAGVDCEVDVAGGKAGVGKAVGDGGADRDILKADGAPMEDERQLILCGGNLADSGRQRAKAERDAESLLRHPALLEVHNVRRRCAAQVPHEAVVADVGRVIPSAVSRGFVCLLP